MNIIRQRSVATLVTDNLVNGSAFEYPQQPSQLSIGVNQATTGGFLTIYAGARLIVEEFPPTVAGAYPVVPDAFFFNFVILPGERLVLSYRNPTGGAIVVWFVVDMQPIAR